MITTTLNIHINNLLKISRTADRLNKTRKDIIVLLLMRMMKDHRLFSRSFSTVKYQRNDDSGNWHCFHIRFRPDENEFFVDLRKVCKVSVSCLLAMAVERYLNEIIQVIKNEFVDNYPLFENYVLRQEDIDGIISWRIYWGLPMAHLKTIRL